jgi:hypothetical protein
VSERIEDENESLTRRILTLGLGAYFLTEDTVRRYVKDAKIPRDIASGIVKNATKGKDELYGFVARELQGFLKQMDVQAEIDRFVRSHKVRISAEIEFIPRTPPERSPTDKGSDEAPASPEFEWNVTLKKPDDEKPAP